VIDIPPKVTLNRVLCQAAPGWYGIRWEPYSTEPTGATYLPVVAWGTAQFEYRWEGEGGEPPDPPETLPVGVVVDSDDDSPAIFHCYTFGFLGFANDLDEGARAMWRDRARECWHQWHDRPKVDR